MPVREKNLIAALTSLGEDFGSVLPKAKDDRNGPDFAAQLGAALMADSASAAPGARTADGAVASSVADKTRTRFSTTSGQRTPAQAPTETLALLAASVPAQVPSTTSDAAPSRKGSDSSASTATSIPPIEAYASAAAAPDFTREVSASAANSDSRRDAGSTSPETESRAAGATYSVVNPTSHEQSSPATSAAITQDAAVEVTITRNAPLTSPNPKFAQVGADAPHAISGASVFDLANTKRESDAPAIQRSSTEVTSVSTQKLASTPTAGATVSVSKQALRDEQSSVSATGSGERNSAVEPASPAVQRGTSAANNDRSAPVGRKTLTTGDGIATLTASDTAQQPNTPVANVFKTPAKAGTADSAQATGVQQAQSQHPEAAGLVLQPAKSEDGNRDKMEIAPKSNGTPQGNSAQSPIADAQPQRVAPAAPVAPVHDSAPQPAQHTAKLTVELDGGGAAHATIRERAGAIDVKITAPGADSARHFATEVSALRRSLDDAGMILRNAEISYRSDGQQQSQHQESGQSRQQGRADSKEVFLVKENNQ